jgi:hypothetical protein
LKSQWLALARISHKLNFSGSTGKLFRKLP